MHEDSLEGFTGLMWRFCVAGVSNMQVETGTGPEAP